MNPNNPDKKKDLTPVVIEGEVIVRKKSLGRKAKETLFGGDVKGVGNYILIDVLIPAIRNTIVDAITEGIEHVIFPDGRGGGGGRTVSRSGSSFGTVNYQSRFRGAASTAANTAVKSVFNTRPDPREERAALSNQARAQHDFSELVIPSRAAAQDILTRMIGLIEDFDVVTVGEMMHLIGKTADWADEKYGWDDLSSGRVVRDRRTGGYLLDLPKPIPLTN